MMREQLYHHSHQPFYRSPFGAVPVSQEVTLRLGGTLMPTAHKATVRLWREGLGEELIAMKPLEQQETGKEVWEARFMASKKPGLVWYYFVVEHAEGIRYYGNNPQRLGGLGQMQLEAPYSWQLTVHREQLQVPDWYKEGIMYQIFPDRFHNGLSRNRIRSPKKNSFLYGHWEDDPVYVKDPVTGSMLRWDFHGGNLEGIIEKLPYLKSLGVSILYLNPIFEAASNHRYDTGDYKKIDPMLGSEATFEALCQQAEAMGIRVILDGVFSHTGSDSRYFNREGNYSTLGAYHSKNSPYFPWYRFKEYPEEYDCWWGIDTMPNTNEMEHSFRNYVIDDEDSVVRRWLRKGASGWRLDVADELPAPFIRELRQAMKETSPESVLIGEVWEDASNKVAYGERREYLLGDELDAVMNYPFREAMIRFFTEKDSGTETAMQLMSLYENYPKEAFFSCMNLVGSHDRTRILTVLGEAPEETGLGTQEKIRYRLPKKKRRRAEVRFQLLTAFQMTFPGVPVIYYGDEVGMEGFNDPLNRRTFPWGSENQLLLEWVMKMTALRNSHDVFTRGEWQLLSTGENHIAFTRSHHTSGKGQMAVVALNRHEKHPAVFQEKMPHAVEGPLTDLISGHQVAPEGEWLTLELAPQTVMILLAPLKTTASEGGKVI